MEEDEEESLPSALLQEKNLEIDQLHQEIQRLEVELESSEQDVVRTRTTCTQCIQSIVNQHLCCSSCRHISMFLVCPPLSVPQQGSGR